MSITLNKHRPEESGGEVTVLAAAGGELVVDTLLRELHWAQVSLAQDLVAGAAHVTYTKEPRVPGDTAKIRIKVWENTIVVAAASVDAVVSLTAVGN